jgi:penicillin-binding protein 1C
VGTTAGFTVAVWVGNFSGRPMDGVSGVTGAGPLLHRAVRLTAERVAPGALPSPASTGAAPVAICRLSGLRATPDCPRMTEWFAPGTEPARPDDWQRADGTVTLPPEFREWADQYARERVRVAAVDRSAEQPDTRFRIVSPQDGDRYRVPPGVDPRYSTIALRAAGAAGDIAWTIDGRPTGEPRFRLAPGTHVIRARAAGGQMAEVRIIVE